MTTVRDNAAARRFELDEAGHTAFADYRRVGDVLVIDHVEAPLELRGTGAAGRLMQGVVDAARSARIKISPLCGYAAAWLRRRPEHAHLIA